MLNMNAISLEQTANSLRIGVQDLHEILTDFAIRETDGMISLDDAENLNDLLDGSDYLNEMRARNYLRVSVKSCTMIFDTCALLHGMFPTLFRNLSPILAEAGRKMIVPSSVVTELHRLFLRRMDRREDVRRTLALLDEGQRAGTVEISGEEANFADQQVLAMITALRTIGKVLLVTQDSALSEDALGLNDLGSVHGWPVIVNRVSQFGFLGRYTSQQNAAPVRVGQQTVLS